MASERRCPLCRRVVMRLSDHHLVPRSRGGTHQEKVPICPDCHHAIHAMLSSKELERDYNTVEALLANERVAMHLAWLRKQDPRKRFRSALSRDQRTRGRNG